MSKAKTLPLGVAILPPSHTLKPAPRQEGGDSGGGSGDRAPALPVPQLARWVCPQRVRPGSRPSPPARGRPEGVRAPDGRVRRRAVRTRTRTVQRREDRATEDRAAAAACTPKPGGRPRCSGTVIASNQNLAALQGKWPGALWPQAPTLCDPGCAGRPPRPL